MSNETNILILSAGTRNRVVRAFKEALHGEGRVIATDCSPLGPAIYDADGAYIVPRIDDPGYLDRIVEICVKENVTGLFSLIDPELSLIAKHRERFLEVGATPVVSSYELCETSLNKLEMASFFRDKGVRTANCYADPESFFAAKARGEIDYPVFIKPVMGSASINIDRIENDEQVRTLFGRYEGLMIQEFMHGQEYGADVYIDMISGKCTQIFLKKKIKMKGGETDKSVSVKDEELFRQVRRFVEESGFYGMIDIDLFLDEKGWCFGEVNPRFGGGYPHAYACGADFPSAVIRNLRGEATEESIGSYRENVYMMKYNELCIRDAEELYQ